MSFLCRLGVIVFAAVSLSACALMEDTVSLQYHPMPSVSAVPGAANISIAVVMSDARTEHVDRVSVKKNGYGMEMAAIRSDRNVLDIVKDSIETELKARGFKVADGGSQARVDLIAFYNDFKVGFFSGDAIAQVTFNVQVIGANGTILYSKPVSSTGKAPDILLANGSNAKTALENGLQTAVANLMVDSDFIAAVMKAGGGGKTSSTPVS